METCPHCGQRMPKHPICDTCAYESVDAKVGDICFMPGCAGTYEAPESASQEVTPLHGPGFVNVGVTPDGAVVRVDPTQPMTYTGGDFEQPHPSSRPKTPEPWPNGDRN